MMRVESRETRDGRSRVARPERAWSGSFSTWVAGPKPERRGPERATTDQVRSASTRSLRGHGHAPLGPATRACLLSAFVATVTLVCSGAVAADEPKTPELPVRDGLEVWLDVSRLEAPKLGTPEMLEGVPVAVWPDSSGRGRDVKQEKENARPRVFTVGDGKIVRFDGVDDHLRATGLGLSTDAMTVFLVAAPHMNFGAFPGFLALNEKGVNDYTSGITIDQGPSASTTFSSINVEGEGFQVAANLMQTPMPFGSLPVVEAVVSPSAKNVRLTVDGKPQGTRPLDSKPLTLDELTVGARYYGHGMAPVVQGFITADFAEVLVYSRELSAEESEQVRTYLHAKHAGLRDGLKSVVLARGGKPLESILDPPPVQMFVPGLSARELPVDLPNINNVRYRPDGKLVALAYDGDVYLLSDTDGDGLEDKADLFWDNPGRVRAPIGMALTPPGYKHGQGLFFPTKSECLLITDTDGDDKADKETVVATGWQESFHGVDALGVAVDPKDHSVYFGLGTGNFADPFMKDKEGKPTYRLDGERSTILKVSPDFSKREVFCTGIRFPVALGINREGDLFATDQEGATWVPNGNPLDELLHIRQGRHYGFPPRHPKLLPNVTDEPSNYDYSPQHQSICGLTFNDPAVVGGPFFGPNFWFGDAITCGYSRGKLYRTKLAKTPAGYVADNRLIGSLDMLTVDSGVAPNGDLVIAVHSGGPDWGSGPGGKGKLYKVAYVDREAPQPVATWASSPTEVRIAFDRPLDPEKLRNVAAETEITYGPAVRAGDEFELLRPGYAIVAGQMASVRRDLPVRSASITADRRTLLLATDPHPSAVWYAVRLPGLGRPSEEAETKAGNLPQLPRVDLDYSLGGVEATWEGEGTSWAGWLPHLELAASRTFTQGSAEHEALWPSLAKKGRLRLRTQIDLSHMLRARVQPGSELDYELTPEQVTVTFSSSGPFTLKAGGDEGVAKERDGRYESSYGCVTETDSPPVPVEVVLETGGEPDFTVSWTTAESDIPRQLATVRMTLPWAKAKSASDEAEPEATVPELAGGSWARGRAVFFSDAAACAKCHAVHGQGGTIGPSLSNLVHRDYASVLRDVENPSYAVNPDFVSHTVVLNDGRVAAGVIRTEGDRLLVGDAQGNVVPISREEVAEVVPQTKSVMPEGIPKLLGPEKMRDLRTFLITKPPHMPADAAGPPPAPRPRAELKAVLEGAPTPPEATRPIKVVLVAGNKDHGPGEHDYPAWQKAWAELLAAGSQVEVGTAWDWPAREDLDTADVLVFYQQGKWTPERAKDIDAYLKRGGGLVYIHYAVDGGADAPGFAQRIGLAWGGPGMRFRHGPLDLGFETGSKHPIGRNFDKLGLVDESYWNLVGDPSKIDLLASGVEDGEARPLFWTIEPSNGRVFVSIPGHYSWSFDDPLFRVLLLRGIAWTAKEPVDRFNELAEPGARVAD